MYCKNCGKEISENAYVCPHCGVLVSKQTQVSNRTSDNAQSNTMAIVGLILSFLIPLAGLICSIIGYKKSADLGGSGKVLALAGIIISAVFIALSLILSIVYVAVLGAILA